MTDVIEAASKRLAGDINAAYLAGSSRVALDGAFARPGPPAITPDFLSRLEIGVLMTVPDT